MNFLWLKKVSFVSRTVLNIISSLILTENNSRKKTTFFDLKHGLTPLEKCDFLGLWKNTFFRAKKRFLFYLAHYLTLFLVLFWPKTTQEKKNTFFDQKHGLTPLEKWDFWDFKRLTFYGQKRFLFFLEHYLTLFLVSFWLKTSQEKNYIFWPKAWVNPFGKMRFLGLWKIEFFMAKKGLVLYLKHFKHYF